VHELTTLLESHAASFLPLSLVVRDSSMGGGGQGRLGCSRAVGDTTFAQLDSGCLLAAMIWVVTRLFFIA
jgi:hypothetical protein